MSYTKVFTTNLVAGAGLATGTFLVLIAATILRPKNSK